MFIVKLNKMNYEYDVHSIVKAFYAEEQVKVVTPGSKDWNALLLEGKETISIEIAEDRALVTIQGQRYSFQAPTQEFKNGFKKF